MAEVGHRNAVAQALDSLGEVARLEGDLTAAQETFDETLAQCRRLGMEEDEAMALSRVGALARQRGELERAESLHRQALAIGARLSASFPMVHAVEGLAGIAAAREDADQAARLFGAAESLRVAMSAPLPPVYRASHDADVAAVRQALGDDRFDSAWAEGGATALQDVLVSLGVAPEDRDGRTSGPLPATYAATATPAIFRRDGEYFTLAFRGPPFRLKDSKGLRHMARLLRHPGREFHALDLATEAAGMSPRQAAAGAGLTARRGTGDAGEVLDATARKAYQRRLEDLRDEVREAQEWNDPERAARAREEMGFLAQELAAGFGLGGRARRAASTSERARLNVTRAIRSAIARIEEGSPELARYLSSTITTGTFCRYTPDPRFPTTWVL